MPRSQSTLYETDSQLVNYLKTDKINYRDISLPRNYPNIQKFELRIAVILESSNALSKFPNAEELFYHSIISMLSNYFIEVKPYGIIDNKRSIDSLINQLQESKEVDVLLFVSDINLRFAANYENMNRELIFTYTFRDFWDETSFNHKLSGYRGDKVNLDLSAQKQLLTKTPYIEVVEKLNLGKAFRKTETMI